MIRGVFVGNNGLTFKDVVGSMYVLYTLFRLVSPSLKTFYKHIYGIGTLINMLPYVKETTTKMTLI